MRTSSAYGRDRSDANDVEPGHGTSFDAVFRQNYDRVYSLAFRLCGERTQAEDLAQDTFVKAARGWANFRGEAEPWSWLYRITVNGAADELRKNRRSERMLRKYATSGSAHSNCRIDSGDDLGGRVPGAVLALPIRQRAALVLTICEGLSHRAAANILGCSETTVSWHVHRAKKALKQALQGSEHHE